MPSPTRDQARLQFFICLPFVVPVLLGLALALAIRFWVGALMGAAILLQISVWLKGFYAVGWPDSRPRFPFGFFPSLSRKQRALLGLAFGIFWAAFAVLVVSHPVGFVLGAVILAMSLFVLVITLKGKGWPGQERNEK